MDMSFANQALCVEFLARRSGELDRRVHAVPEEIDRRVASLKLAVMNLSMDRLTLEQQE